MKKSNLIYLFLLNILILACAQENKSFSINKSAISKLNGLTITYQLIGENLSKRKIIYNSSETDFLPNFDSACNFKISPNKENIAYLKNVTIDPYMEFEYSGRPIVVISSVDSKREKKVIKCDFKSVAFLAWISNNELVVSSIKDNINLISIIDLEGKIKKEYHSNNLYKLKMSPCNKMLVGYNIKNILIYNIQKEKFHEIELPESIDISKLPYFKNSAILFKCLYNKHLELNKNNLHYDYIKSKKGEKYLVYADYKYDIYISGDKMQVYRDNKYVETFDISGYSCYSGLSITSNNDFYFVGKLSVGDNIGAIVKINFDSHNITEISNYSEDQIIIDYNYYNFIDNK